jgi:hypothetical protein
MHTYLLESSLYIIPRTAGLLPQPISVKNIQGMLTLVAVSIHCTYFT